MPTRTTFELIAFAATFAALRRAAARGRSSVEQAEEVRKRLRGELRHASASGQVILRFDSSASFWRNQSRLIGPTWIASSHPNRNSSIGYEP